MKARRIAIFTVMVVAALALDQGSKAWARTLPLGEPHPVIAGYWDWEHAENPGAAFSSFIGGTGARVALSLVATAALAAIGFAAWRTRPAQRARRIAYALIAAGALGNLVDRVRVGTVTDFVRWHVRGHMWPIFNVGDALLLVGAAVLLLSSLRGSPSASALGVPRTAMDPRFEHEDPSTLDRDRVSRRLHQ
jgi:signal peptidase II